MRGLSFTLDSVSLGQTPPTPPEQAVSWAWDAWLLAQSCVRCMRLKVTFWAGIPRLLTQPQASPER